MGPGDTTYLQHGGVALEAIRAWVKGITGEDAPFTELPPGAPSLHAGVPGLHQIISGYLPCDEWGLMSDSPAQAPRPPPPATRGKRVAEDSGGESELSWTDLESSGDEAGQVAGTQAVLPAAAEEDEDEDDTLLIVWRLRAPVAAATSAVYASIVAASAATGGAATPRAPTALPKRGLFRGFEFKVNPPKDGTSTGAGKRGRDDSPPAAPSKKPRTRASASAAPGGTGASGAPTAPAVDPIPVEEEPAADPTAPTMGAGVAVVDLGSDADDAETREESEEAPAPSSTAPDTTVAAPTVGTEAELGGASRAT
ncbi:cell wall adhesin EAP1-like [Brachypodium distachyon]|uniref:cell wall adhesin EAP1-like n=1 Tax=Brachypodium distachyon TaxID=15368 RepID=UPI00071DF9AF|nr:cell wall adhesin EAP1-like [Brachypodium distachyon]|eukprot:XP_014756051.1 cell wall adhesin EAP1-like [Brachypodium distachyon]